MGASSRHPRFTSTTPHASNNTSRREKYPQRSKISSSSPSSAVNCADAVQPTVKADDNKTQQEDLESLQITFYEIETWIEKATPALARMTNELEKASHQFQKRRKSTHNQPLTFTTSDSTPISTTTTAAAADHNSSPTSIATTSPNTSSITSHSTGNNVTISGNPTTSSTLEDCSVPWSLSFQPGNSLRLETNITSLDQLIEALRKIRILVDEPSSSSSSRAKADSAKEDAVSSPSIPNVELWIDPLEVDLSTEYWHVAIRRRPQTCLENYKHCEMDLSRLTEDVLPNVLNYIGQVFWDCLHPKFTCDWYSFWDRSGDPRRNQVCIDSGLAIVFLHVIRHDRNACSNARDIAYYYYDRARESLMEFFDSPDCATLETLLNLAMFCMICKRHSQARIYITLAFRMMLEMGMHKWPKLRLSRIVRKQYMKLFMVLYYNDLTTSLYSGDPFIIMDEHCDVNFYEVIELNEILFQNGEGGCNENMVVKETYFTHLLELARIGKRTRHLMRGHEEQSKQHCRQHMNDCPVRWTKQIFAIELALAQWFDRLPDHYRVDPQPREPPLSDPSCKRCPRERHPMPPELLLEQSGPLLMLQYQMQWILLHKAFFTGKTDAGAPKATTLLEGSDSPQKQQQQQQSERSRLICIDAASRIVVLAELISEKYGWCVCQQFIHCIYQASTIFCRVALSKDNGARQHAKYMIYRIMRILRSSHNFQGLPNDLTACLHEFLADHGMQNSCHEALDDEANMRLIDQFFLCVKALPHCEALLALNDASPNSPHMHKQILEQAKAFVL